MFRMQHTYHDEVVFIGFEFLVFVSILAIWFEVVRKWCVCVSVQLWMRPQDDTHISYAYRLRFFGTIQSKCWSFRATAGICITQSRKQIILYEHGGLSRFSKWNYASSIYGIILNRGLWVEFFAWAITVCLKITIPLYIIWYNWVYSSVAVAMAARYYAYTCSVLPIWR